MLPKQIHTSFLQRFMSAEELKSFEEKYLANKHSGAGYIPKIEHQNFVMDYFRGNVTAETFLKDIGTKVYNKDNQNNHSNNVAKADKYAAQIMRAFTK